MAQPGINAQTVNPLALQIGALIGLFTKEPGDTYSLNTDWFKNPWDYIKAVPSQPGMLELVGELLSSASGTALGTPKQLLAHTWYPILKQGAAPGDTTASGLYFVSADAEPGKGTEFGIGALYEWKKDDIDILPYAYFPLLLLPKDKDDSFSFILGKTGHPVQTGINITGSDGLFNTGNGVSALSFDGFNAGSQIYFDGALPSLELVFLNLKLPGDSKGSNRSLADLVADASVQQFITIALSVLGSQLAQLNGAGATAGKMINSLLELLGLLGPLPGIDWEALVHNPADAGRIITRWLQSIASSPEALKNWLNDWYCLFKGLDASEDKNYITGQGTREDPFNAALLTLPVSNASITINLSFATSKTEDGLGIYPGFSMVSSPIVPLPALPALGIKMVAAAEILCYTLPPTFPEAAPVISLFPKYNLLVSAVNTTDGKPLFAVGDTFGAHELTEAGALDFSIGSMAVGFSYEEAATGGAASKVPCPDFKLYDVQTAIGAWPLIDLSNFNLNTVEQAIGPVVSAAIKSFFGAENTYATAFTAILGINAPASYSGDWPLADQLLLAPAELPLLISNPFAAIGAYYTRCLLTKDDKEAPLFSYLVPYFAGLLGGDGKSVTGKGTAEDPWQSSLFEVGGATIFLTLWQQDDNRLSIAFDFSLPLPFITVQAVTGMRAEMMVLQLPAADGTGDWNAAWMQSITASLRLSNSSGQPLQTPAIGGVHLSAGDIYVLAGWKNGQNFVMSGAMEKVALQAASVTIDLGDIILDTKGWDVDQLKKFTPAIVSGVGLLLLENGGRVGVALTALLGMLPNLPDIFNGNKNSYPFPVPGGIVLPANWPVLSVTDYKNPWKDAVAQWMALFRGGSAFMEPALRLLAWGITGEELPAPAIVPAGTLSDPWEVHLDKLLGVDLLAWNYDAAQTGVGLQRIFSTSVAGAVELVTLLRATLPAFAEDAAQLADTDTNPAFYWLNLLQNSDATKPLYEFLGITIGKVQIGACMQWKDGAFGLVPVFRFIESRWTHSEPLQTIELISVEGKPQFTCALGIPIFNTLIHALMGKLSDGVAADTAGQLSAFLRLLTLLEVLDESGGSYSFNPGAWNGILSNPFGYFKDRVEVVLENPDTCGVFLQQAARLLGYTDFTIPPAWQGIQYLLEALGLARNYNGFPVPLTDTWLQLVRNPLAYLQSAVPALFNNSTQLNALLSELRGILPSAQNYFTVDSSGSIITIQVPADKIVNLGNEVRLFADFVINLNAFSLTASVALGVEALQSAIAFQYTPSFKGGKLSNEFGFYLEGMPGITPAAFDPLPLWPFPADTKAWLEQLGFQLPMSLLSSFAAKYLNGFAVPENPAVSAIFKVLGLTTTTEDGKPQIRPLAGIFMHPVQWLLSPAALGDGSGGIDLSKLGQLLYAIVSTGVPDPGKIQLLPYEHDGKKDGVQLSGLPWGVSFILYANATAGVNLLGHFAPALPGPAPDIILDAGVACLNGNGIHISGSIAMKYVLGTTATADSLGLIAAYADKQFSLTATANAASFKLLPFEGLNQFLNDGLPGVLLTIIGNKLFGAYDSYVKTHPSTPLQPFIESIKLLSGITSGESLYNFFNVIYNDPLGQFNEANIQKAIPNIYKFLTTILTLDGFSISADNKLLQYKHVFAALPNAGIAVNIGLREQAGKTLFGLWFEPVAGFEWISIGLANTGLGVQMPVDYDHPQLSYSLNILAGINLSGFNIPGVPNPVLLFGLEGDFSAAPTPQLTLYPVAQSDADGTLAINILPHPELVIVGKQDVTALQWTLAFGVDFLVPFIGNMGLMQTPVVKWLDDTVIGSVKGAPGKILLGWELIVQPEAGGRYYLNDLKKAFDPTKPVEIVTRLLFSALDLLDGQRVVPVGDHGIYIASEADGAAKRYGVRVQIPSITLTDSLNSDGATLSLVLGDYFGGQDQNNNWTGLKSDPGVIAYLLKKDGETLSLSPKFELVSIGLNFEGANPQKPLINVKGVTIQAIQPRAYVSLDLEGGISTDFGAAIFLSELGVPMGPGFGNQGANSNPVAQNLLTSGGNPGKTDAINPAFSMSVSYLVNEKAFDLQLYDENNMPAEKVWIGIMRAFGPLQCRKVGIGWQRDSKPQKMDFLFDGDVSLAGLMVNLVELDIAIPVTEPTNFDEYKLDLAGLDISYNGGAVSIAGGFLRDDSMGYIQYTGQAKIQTPSFALGAFGAYALIDGHPSMFIFAYINAPLGGPPFFFLNGLAGGFGYNRTINIPPANQIENFPFVAGVDNPAVLGGEDGKPPTNEQALTALGTTIVPPQLGSYWVAAGVTVSSFDLIDVKAVVMVIFGNDFEIALLGLAGLVLPKSGRVYVGAQMAFKVTYKASTGLLAVEAVLTSNSYVIDSHCRLTGGLAFYLWFKDQPETGARAGDFVFTLGGYNPHFPKPSFYPDEPLLGFSWLLPEVNISIKGGAYFALTPSAVMAGGSLEAVYDEGNLKAWFIAYADFLIMWHPFHYDIGVGINVGASYTIHFIWTTTFRVELGADLHLWGPDMAGTVTIHWWVISFTISFGATGTDPDPVKIIGWDDFKTYFLPEDQVPAAPPQQLPADPNKRQRQAAAGEPVALKLQQVTQIKQANGLIKELDNDGSILWQVRAEGFAFNISTQAPLNTIIFHTSDAPLPPITSTTEFGIYPMGSVVFGTTGQLSSLDLTIDYMGAPGDLSRWSFPQELSGVPESLWGTVNDGSTKPGAKIIPGVLTGITGATPVAQPLPPAPDAFPASNLGYAAWAWRKLTLDSHYFLAPSTPAVASNQSLIIIQNTIMDESKGGVVDKRTAILQAILNAGVNVSTSGRLDQMAAYASITFQSFPMLGQLGSLAEATTAKAAAGSRVRVPAVVSKTADPAPVKPLRLKAVIAHYRRPAISSPVLVAATAVQNKQLMPSKAMLFGNGYTEAWKVQAIAQGVAVISHTAGKTTAALNIHPGTAVLMELDAAATAPRVVVAGPQPVVAVCFNRHNQLLGYARWNNGSYELPLGVTGMCLTPFDTADHPPLSAVGWHYNSELTLINPNALGGIESVVIPDAPIRVRHKRRTSAWGLVTGHQMLLGNRIRDNQGRLYYAGIETVLPTGLSTVAILLRKDGSPEQDVASLSPRLGYEHAGGIQYRPLRAAQRIDGDQETALLYTLPADTGLSYNRIYAVPPPGWAIAGVLGLVEDAAAVYNGWQQVALLPAVPEATITDPPPAIITIIQ